MAKTRTPETSTVRSSLDIIAAVEDLTVTPDTEQVEHIETIMRQARELRPHQVDDLLGHLRARADAAAAKAEAAEAEDSPDAARWIPPGRVDALQGEMDRLGEFIAAEIGLPDEDISPVAAAIRLLRDAYVPAVEAEGDADEGEDTRARADELAARVRGDDDG